MAITPSHRTTEEHEESFFVSMTDMMVGMLFLFIIMLMFFAMKFSDDSGDLQAQIQILKKQLALLQGAESTRSRIVNEIGHALKEKGVDVTIDADNGLLRLPESILFDTNKSDIKEDGKIAVKKLAAALYEVLPCYTTNKGLSWGKICPPTAFGVNALLIEGHTDTDGYKARNWELSVQRALATYQLLIKEQEQLDNMCSPQQKAGEDPYPILSIAGFASNRPVPRQTDESDNAYKKRNRRIDLRFIITPPDEKTLDTARRAIQ